MVEGYIWVVLVLTFFLNQVGSYPTQYVVWSLNQATAAPAAGWAWLPPVFDDQNPTWGAVDEAALKKVSEELKALKEKLKQEAAGALCGELVWGSSQKSSDWGAARHFKVAMIALDNLCHHSQSSFLVAHGLQTMRHSCKSCIAQTQELRNQSESYECEGWGYIDKSATQCDRYSNHLKLIIWKHENTTRTTVGHSRN